MIAHIVGNRPQFIKLAPLYMRLEQAGYQQCIIHSGQHYDENMSDIFFEELGIPAPCVNLGAGGGSHAQVTAKVMTELEEELLQRKPDLIVLYGDTNTTLAAAITAAKLCIPIAHVEAGPRTHVKTNPEECNRIVTDHLSDILFCPDSESLENLKREGLGEKAYMTGDLMYDTYLSISERMIKDDMPEESEEIVLMTWHRQENTADRERMACILRLVERLESKVVCPLHPRTRKCLAQFGLLERAEAIPNLEIIDPVGYVEMVKLMNRARLILTDSGGVSKESSFAGAKCLFMLNLDIWEDLLREHWICRVNPEQEDSVEEALAFAEHARRVAVEDRPRYYGDGCAAQQMLQALQKTGLVGN